MMKTTSRLSTTRRHFLQLASALPGLILMRPLWARSESFEATQVDQALALLTDGPAMAEHADIELDVPDVAEDAGKVPIQVHAPLPGIQKISVLVEANPSPLISISHIIAPAEPYVSLRVKMRATTRVIALAHTSEGIFKAEREVSVTAGGCA